MLLKRRDLLRGIALGSAGAAATLTTGGAPLWASSEAGIASPMAGGMHFAPRAKRVIYIWQAGAMSQFESFVDKPALYKWDGQRPFGHRLECQQDCMKPLAEYARYGESGTSVSSFFPHIAEVIDEFTLVYTLRNFAPAHPAAGNFLFTGERVGGKPSLGAWTNWAIGSENPNLPGFINLGYNHGYNKNGYLPSNLHGVFFATDGKAAVDFLDQPERVDTRTQKNAIDAVRQLDHMAFEQSMDSASLAHGKVYELAYQMQSSIPEVMDVDGEPDHIRELYGIDDKDTKAMGVNLLSARRLVEQGVRFVNVSDGSWDHHTGIDKAFPKKAVGFDKPLRGLITDLKQRGLLDDTLVVVTGEFGRTPFNEGALAGGFGRGHNPRSGMIMLAGGAVKQGFSYGETDDFGFDTVKDPVSVNDLNATILYALGIDHRRLTYELGGRNFKATGVGEASIVTELFS